MRELPEGCKTWVEHERIVEVHGKEEIILPYGGRTIVKILDENEDVLAIGVAECSERDNYNKKIGREIATGRALKHLERILS